MAEHLQTLGLERSEDGLVVVTLNRPEVRNALNTQMGMELRRLFAPLAFEPQDVRCIVITGAGDKAFCAGGDLKERNGMTDTQWRTQHAIFEEAFYAVMGCTVPVIAAVNGAAYGGGCELALACDFIYAAREACFALSETTLGIMPGCGGTQNLPRAVGERRAKELIMTGRPFSAAEALQWGMVNRVVEASELLPRTLEVARTLCANAPISVRQAKKAIHHGLDVGLRTGLAFEIEAYNRTVGTEDRLEGVRAFGEKRRPRFSGK
ncbi:MAG: enoyl-CoA hydratase [Betaproteobacteria bacterium RIFCSPLOWO2_12_FULL_62_13]|nr:MAG: enoyl-CoA hydratase [Betaproteobacteria bacterium RIFCSPLOWO2_12_FULL_62_13]